MASTPLPSGERPQRPWQPARLHVFGVYRRERRPRARAAHGANRRRPATVSYDVRFEVDGHAFRYGFERKGWADTFADKLQEHLAAGYLFDPQTRRFVVPEAGSGAGPTFLEHAADHFARKWPQWSPARRQDAQRELARACLYLLRDDAPALDVDERLKADAFLRRAVFMVPAPAHATDQDRDWRAWFARWSLPLRQVDDRHLHAFLEIARTQALDGTARIMAPTTLARTRAVVRAAFTTARKRRLIEWDPWDAVEWTLHSDEEQIDPDLVMDQPQVLALAAVCGAIEQRYECFVLAQGVCGLRPGEARDVRRRDFDLDAKPATITVRGSHSDVPDRFFAAGESRRRPLKGHAAKARRSIPIPTALVPRFQAHLDEFVPRRAEALVFTTPTGKRIHLSNFHRDVWQPAREQVFAEDSPLRSARRHDLRHSAITAWLNAGVMLKTAQRWSGHRTASVLLNTYLGVMRDDLSTSLARVEEALAKAQEDAVSWQAGDSAYENHRSQGANDGEE